MTYLEMLLKMYSWYGKDSEVVKHFKEVMKSPNIKKRHLETIVKCHEKKFKEFSKNP